jgi:hypothetical protein
MSKKTQNKKQSSIKKTKKNNLSNSRTFIHSQSKSLVEFQKEITVKFLETILLIKLYHWKTMSFATHKATDELYAKMNSNMDSFVEILLGKTGERTHLEKTHEIRLIDLNSHESMKKEMESFKTYLISMNENIILQDGTHTDLLNIRDTILGDINQFLYLFTFQ